MESTTLLATELLRSKKEINSCDSITGVLYVVVYVMAFVPFVIFEMAYSFYTTNQIMGILIFIGFTILGLLPYYLVRLWYRNKKGVEYNACPVCNKKYKEQHAIERLIFEEKCVKCQSEIVTNDLRVASNLDDTALPSTSDVEAVYKANKSKIRIVGAYQFIILLLIASFCIIINVGYNPQKLITEYLQSNISYWLELDPFEIMLIPASIMISLFIIQLLPVFFIRTKKLKCPSCKKEIGTPPCIKKVQAYHKCPHCFQTIVKNS